jgi:4-carboxymuconolactone decarboxylase
MHTVDGIRSVAPALDRYSDVIITELWQRPALSPRDRSIVTVAALIARSHLTGLPQHLNLALDNGVTPGEISEVITHLSFYAGWANAMSAVTVAKDVFRARGVRADQLPSAAPILLPLDDGAEEERVASVEARLGTVAPGLVQYTTDVLFRDLWLRPDLAPRDRSLVTVAALLANGQAVQLSFHLNKAMDNGLTAEQAGETVTHLAFYSGWPTAFSAATVLKDVIESRSQRPPLPDLLAR